MELIAEFMFQKVPRAGLRTFMYDDYVHYQSTFNIFLHYANFVLHLFYVVTALLEVILTVYCYF